MKRSLIFLFAYISLCLSVLAPSALEFLSQNTEIYDRLSKLRPIASTVMVVAHRGASEYAPENTLAAFNQAIRMHTDYIELDLQMTKDDRLVAMHDESLERTTNAKKLFPQRSPWLVRDFSLKEINKLDAGSWFNRSHKNKYLQEYKQQHVPTLNEVLQLVRERGNGKTGLYIEIKSPNLYPGVEQRLVDILRKNGFLHKNNLFFVSLSETSLRTLKALAPDVKMVQLYSGTMLDNLDLNQEFKRISEYAAGVGINKKLIDTKLIELAHLNGLFVHSWGVNKRDDLAELLSLGVDGIITNKPESIAGFLDMTISENRLKMQLEF